MFPEFLLLWFTNLCLSCALFHLQVPLPGEVSLQHGKALPEMSPRVLGAEERAVSVNQSILGHKDPMWLEFLCSLVFPRHLGEILCPCSWLTSPIWDSWDSSRVLFPVSFPTALSAGQGLTLVRAQILLSGHSVLYSFCFHLKKYEPKMLILSVLPARAVLRQKPICMPWT